MNRKYMAISAGFLALMLVNVASANTPLPSGGPTKGPGSGATPVASFNPNVVNNNNATTTPGVTPPVTSPTITGPKAVSGLPAHDPNKHPGSPS